MESSHLFHTTLPHWNNFPFLVKTWKVVRFAYERDIKKYFCSQCLYFITRGNGAKSFYSLVTCELPCFRLVFFYFNQSRKPLKKTCPKLIFRTRFAPVSCFPAQALWLKAKCTRWLFKVFKNGGHITRHHSLVKFNYISVTRHFFLNCFCRWIYVKESRRLFLVIINKWVSPICDPLDQTGYESIYHQFFRNVLMELGCF